MAALTGPILYGLHRLAGGGGSGTGTSLTGAFRSATAAGVFTPPAAGRIPSPSPEADARIARDAAALARRKAGAVGNHGGTLLTGGAGLANEPAPQRASLLGA